MIWLVLELVVVAIVVLLTIFWGLEASITGALSAAGERPGEALRDAVAIRDAVREAAWMYVAGIAALVVARLLYLRRDKQNIGVGFILPAVTVATGLGLVLQWGYSDPIHSSDVAGLGFAPGVFYGGIIAAVLMIVPWDPAVWADRLRWPIAAGAVGTLVALKLVGEAPGSSGAKVRLFGVQPIEAVKLAFIVFLAVSLGRLAEQLRYQRVRRGFIQIPRLKLLLPAILLLGLLFTGLIVVRDLGPTLILALVFLSIYYVVTRSWMELALGGGALALMVYFLVTSPPSWVPRMVLLRLEMWADPWLNGRPGGDQMASSLWALASGGWNGQGWGQGAVGAIQAGHTDLILSHLAEVGGFLGLLVYLVCLLVLVSQGLWIAYHNRTPERILLAFGLAMLLFCQWLIIFSGSVGLLPLTGVVVPFLSYGKTSMVAFLALVGLLFRLAADGRPVVDRDALQQLRGGLNWVFAAVLLIWTVAVFRGFELTVIDRTASTRGVLTMLGDETIKLKYDPRLLSIAGAIQRGEILDRRGEPLVGTSDGERFYPLGAAMGTLLTPMDAPIQTPSWSIEKLLDSRLRGLAPAEEELAVWVERHPEQDRILFSVPTREYRDQDEIEARSMLRPDGKVFFTRSTLRDYSPLLPILRRRGEAKKQAVQQLISDVASRTVSLTIDARLQRDTYAALRSMVPRLGQAGAVVIMDVDSGEVLARAQWPDYDPGKQSTWLPKLRNPAKHPRFVGSYGPWRDKTGVGGFYQTGSIFKVATALAWARIGMPVQGSSCGLTGTRHYNCELVEGPRPSYKAPGWTKAIRDGHRGADGRIEVVRALEVSCNVFFSRLGLDLGPEPFKSLVAAGLEVDGKTSIEPGELGSRSLASTAFGQGAARMHTMEAARMVTAIADGGIYKKCPPSMELGAPCESRRLIDDETRLQPILAGMKRVIDRGTAKRFGRIPGIRVYAKTGTATDPGRKDEERYGFERGKTYKDHSWFIAIAEPSTNPSCAVRAPKRLAFAVVVPRGGAGNGSAQSIARRVIQATKQHGYF